MLEQKRIIRILEKSIVIICMILFFATTTFAQKFELHDISQLPHIDETGMAILAFNIAKSYDLAILEPEKYSTEESTKEVVAAFLDKDMDNSLERVNPLNGKKFSQRDWSILKTNNKLLFNLTFDPMGKLIVPDKINVISFQEEYDRGHITKMGLIAFELPITKESRSELQKVGLKQLAAKDINSLTGDLKPVSVQIPFIFSRGKIQSQKYEGKAIVRKGDINIFLNANSRLNQKVEDLIKSETDLLDYKKGEFDFTIEKLTRGYSIDFNILRGMFISNQTQEFTTERLHVVRFEGDGKK